MTTSVAPLHSEEAPPTTLCKTTLRWRFRDGSWYGVKALGAGWKDQVDGCLCAELDCDPLCVAPTHGA
ncbi:hypothetical protein GCM10022233_61880 [Streptomyces shaanxiensis]|uniref:DUF397 domain-containing protein n=1 Tax=Streptomyces shaanxiensis TaxID=653357 RepID=A0ABP7VWB3_9ACTN